MITEFLTVPCPPSKHFSAAESAPRNIAATGNFQTQKAVGAETERQSHREPLVLKHQELSGGCLVPMGNLFFSEREESLKMFSQTIITLHLLHCGHSKSTF